MRLEVEQKYLHRRKNGIWYFLMNVPKKAQALIGSNQIWRSLETQDEGEAVARVRPLIDEYKKKFELGAIGSTTEITFDMVKAVIAKLSIPNYHQAQDVRAASIRDRVEMLSPTIANRHLIKNPTKDVAAALGGAVEVPTLTFKQAFERFKQISPDKVLGKDPHETKRFWRRYEEAVEDFCDEMGKDLDVLKIDVRKANEYLGTLPSIRREATSRV